MSEEGGIPEWTTVEALKGTQLGALIQDYREIEKEIADLEARRAAIRTLIIPLAQTYKGSVRVKDRSVFWTPPKPQAPSLDETKMIRDGVTPDQLSRWKSPRPDKSGFLTIKPVKDPDTEKTITD